MHVWKAEFLKAKLDYLMNVLRICQKLNTTEFNLLE